MTGAHRAAPQRGAERRRAGRRGRRRSARRPVAARSPARWPRHRWPPAWAAAARRASCRARSAAPRAAAPASSMRRIGGTIGESLIGRSGCSARLHVLLERRGSARSDRARGGWRCRRRASPSGAGRPSGWCASSSGSRCGRGRRGRGCRRAAAPSSGCRCSGPRSGRRGRGSGRRRRRRSIRSSACWSSGRRSRCRAHCAMRLDDSWKIVIRIVPFSPICGRMRSVMPTSLRSIVWNGFDSRVPVLVNWPVTNGTLLPTMILASSLSSVTRFGVEVMLVLACDCRKLGDRRQPVGAEEVADQADVEALAERDAAAAVAPCRCRRPRRAAPG